jgi:hypothetical protein
MTSLVLLPRFIRHRDAPGYAGVDRNKFDADWRPYLTEIPMGPRSLVFDRLEIDALTEEHAALKARVRSSRPSIGHRTQLYRHFDRAGKLLYVGVSLSAVSRLAEHLNGSGWAQQIARVDIETFESRTEALRAERLAIIKEAPAYNVVYSRKP